jgi:hypothetical protein
VTTFPVLTVYRILLWSRSHQLQLKLAHLKIMFNFTMKFKVKNAHVIDN